MKAVQFSLLSLLLPLSLGITGMAENKPAIPDSKVVREIPARRAAKTEQDLKEPGALTASGWTEITGPRAEGMPPGDSPLPPVVPSGRPSIGLVLEGGGALGLAHVGVLEWMEDNHVPVDRIAGTSMGALVGGIYATGRPAREVEKIATESNFTKVFTLKTPYTDLSYRRRQDGRDLPQGIEFGLKNGISFRNALLSDRGLEQFLHASLTSYNTEFQDFNRLPIPFRCVATDLNDLTMVVFAGGPLNVALRASISLPGVFPPVQYYQHYLVDGAIMDNLPTDVAKTDFQPDVIIAVHLSSAKFESSDVDSIVGVFARAFSAGTARNERISRKLATLILDLKTDKFSTTDYTRGPDLVRVGYATAEEHRAELMKYALNDADWAAYLADRNSRRRPAPGIFNKLVLRGGSAGAQEKVRRNLAPLHGQPIDQADVFAALGRVQGNGSYSANFETFPSGPGGGSGPDSTSGYPPDTGILVRLRGVRNGPPFLLLGGDLSAMNSNVTRGAFDARFIDQNLGGFGSELRADMRLGFLTQGSVEYYRQLTQNGFFLQPQIGILRQPVYLWTNQVRTSELLQQEAGGGLDLGRTFNRNMQLSMEWREQLVRWHLALGNDTEPDISGTSQTGLLHFVYNSTESGTVSPHGLFLDMSAGAIYHSLNDPDAPLLRIAATKSFTVLDKNILQFSGEGNTYFRRDVSDPLRFTLGGPLRLSASSIDEYRGTDDYLLRAVYLRQLASLPSGLGQGLYFTFGYEGGEIWSPEKSSFLRQDGFTGLVAATPFGAITFATSIGDAGHRKVFFTLGRLF